MKPKTIERGGRPSRSVVINLETHFCIRAHAPAMFLKCLPFLILARNARMCCSYWCLAPPSFLLTGFLATEWFMCTMKTSYHDSRLQILTIYDCNNMFTAGFTVQYVSPCRYVQKMSKEVEGEEAGQRLNGSCEQRNKKKKDYKQDPRGVIDKVFNHGTLSRSFRFHLRKKQPATATSSHQPPASNRQPTANTSSSTRRNFSPGTWVFCLERGRGICWRKQQATSFFCFLSFKRFLGL